MDDVLQAPNPEARARFFKALVELDLARMNGERGLYITGRALKTYDALVRRGLAERQADGSYCITKAGTDAILTHGEELLAEDEDVQPQKTAWTSPSPIPPGEVVPPAGDRATVKKFGPPMVIVIVATDSILDSMIDVLGRIKGDRA